MRRYGRLYAGFTRQNWMSCFGETPVKIFAENCVNKFLRRKKIAGKNDSNLIFIAKATARLDEHGSI